MANIMSLPVEIVQRMAYETGVLEPKDVLSLALSNKEVYALVLGPLGSENVFDRDQHRALGGVLFCAERGWWGAALLATERGVGDVEERPAGEGVYRTPFTLACQGGKVRMVKALMRRGVEPKGYNLVLACMFGAPEVVVTLLEDGRVDPGWNGGSPILAAVKAGFIHVIRLLLEDERVDPAVDNNGAIRLAAQHGRTEVVQVLLGDARVDPAADNDYAIGAAAEGGHVDVVRLLLADARVNPGSNGDYAIFLAAHNGHADVVRLLLADDRVNPAAGQGRPIRFASQNNHTDIVQLLSQHSPP